MITFNPSLLPADTSSVFAIIALITDPAAAKKRLEDMTKLRDDISARQDDLAKASTAADLAKAKSEKDHAEWEATLVKREELADKRARELASKADELDDRDQKVTAWEALLKTQANELATREAHIAQKHSEISARASDLEQGNEQLAKDQADLRRRLDELAKLLPGK